MTDYVIGRSRIPAAVLVASLCMSLTGLSCTADSAGGLRNDRLRGCPAPICVPSTRPSVCLDPPCSEVTKVYDAQSLRRELDEWNPDSEPTDRFKVIEIPDGVAINLIDIADNLPLHIKARVTLQSTRGALRSGALLYLDDYAAITKAVHAANLEYGTVFRVTGQDVQIRNLRLRGPSGATSDVGDACGLPFGAVCPRLMAIEANTEYDTWIADNEIFDWPGAAVRVRGGGDVNECPSPSVAPEEHVSIVRNYIHHNQRAGLGYGVSVFDGGSALIQGNTFDWNRHSVADDGSATSGYSARYNYVLSGGSRYGGLLTYKGSYTQHFDMHGDDAFGDDSDTNDGYGGNGGNVVEIIGNTVHGEQRYGTVLGIGGHTRSVYWLRGDPCTPTELRDNILVHDDEDEAVRADEGWGGAGQVSFANNEFDTDTSWSLEVGDFDRDGRDDIFQATGAAWYYSSGGRTEWRLLQSGRGEDIEQLRFGDFDGDGDTDVFTTADGEWRVSRGGTEAWEQVYTSAFRIGDLRFGDFDGDGTTDAFRASGATWYYYPGAVGEPVPLASSAYLVDELRFGDFDGDGTTDVFGIEGSKWSVSYGGASRWQPLNDLLTSDLASLVLADFDGNGRSDVAQSRLLYPSTIEWRVSWDGVSDWAELHTFTGGSWARLKENWIGEFDSSAGADALRYEAVDSPVGPIEGVYFMRSSGCSEPYKRHSLHEMR